MTTKSAKPRRIRPDTQPPRPSHSPYDVGGSSWRSAESMSQFSIPGGSTDVYATIERLVLPQDDRRADEMAKWIPSISVEFGITDGPTGRDRERSVPFEIRSGDLPVLVSCLIRAAMMADRDGLLPEPLPDEGRDLLRRLNAILPSDE